MRTTRLGWRDIFPTIRSPVNEILILVYLSFSLYNRLRQGTDTGKKKMSPQLAANFTRIGLVFDTLAFFMAAPEILGEKRLNRMRKNLVNALWWTSVILFGLAVLGGIVFALSIAFIVPLMFFLPQAGNFTSNNGIFAITSPLVYYFGYGIILPLAAGLSLQVMRFVEYLTKNSRMRRVLLNLGVLVFIAGAISQFLGTF